MIDTSTPLLSFPPSALEQIKNNFKEEVHSPKDKSFQDYLKSNQQETYTEAPKQKQEKTKNQEKEVPSKERETKTVSHIKKQDEKRGGTTRKKSIPSDKDSSKERKISLIKEKETSNTHLTSQKKETTQSEKAILKKKFEELPPTSKEKKPLSPHKKNGAKNNLIKYKEFHKSLDKEKITSKEEKTKEHKELLTGESFVHHKQEIDKEHTLKKEDDNKISLELDKTSNQNREQIIKNEKENQEKQQPKIIVIDDKQSKNQLFQHNDKNSSEKESHHSHHEHSKKVVSSSLEKAAAKEGNNNSPQIITNFKVPSESNNPQSFQNHFQKTLENNFARLENSRMVNQLQIKLINDNQGEVKLLLKPESLGRVQINLTLKDNSIHGDIIVQNNHAGKLMEQALHDLNKGFREYGYEQSNINVSVGGKENQQGNSSNQQHSSTTNEYERDNFSDSSQNLSENLMQIENNTIINYTV